MSDDDVDVAADDGHDDDDGLDVPAILFPLVILAVGRGGGVAIVVVVTESSWSWRCSP